MWQIDPSGIRIDHASPSDVPKTTSAPKTIAVFIDDCLQDEFDASKGENLAAEESSNKAGKRLSCWSDKISSEAPSFLFGRFVFNYPEIKSQTYWRDASTFLEPERKIATRRLVYRKL